MSKNEETAVLVLAAGRAARMGQPKQLLAYEGKPLICHAAETALASQLGPVSVVLGAYAEACRQHLQGFDVVVFLNENWQEGMGSSLAFGLSQLLTDRPSLQQVLVFPADQPYVPPAHLQTLVEEKSAAKALIAASSYKGIAGAPTLFDRELFGELCQLSGEQGARKLFHQHQDSMVLVPCPEAAWDIDTPADYEKMLKNRHS